MSEEKRIKEYYIEPPISIVEIEWEKRQGRASKLSCVFEINTKIWLSEHLPEYRVAIPENMQNRSEQLEHWTEFYPVEMRFITYVPTGRVIYDNTKPHSEAVVYEYILESLLGKKDLKHFRVKDSKAEALKKFDLSENRELKERAKEK